MYLTTLLMAGVLIASPEAGPAADLTVKDPDTAPRASIDRFSDAAGMLFRRSASPGLPGANQPINFDQAPFITVGLGPNGEVATYYNFDVQPVNPAPIFAFFHEGADTPIEGQLNIIDAIPGDAGYNDFWRVNKVIVPRDYEVNSISSAEDLRKAGYRIEPTNMLVNCPVVPEGSTARHRGGSESAGLTRGWYKGEVVHYFTFEEHALSIGAGRVPLSPIYVTFNKNPNVEGGGPGSGFRTESGSSQTHNVLQTLPGDTGYSPLWLVSVYDNAAFGQVKNLGTALEANILGAGVATVNCPVVRVDHRAS